jgi:nitrite reductase/ring-hydroxylating ferredoxin subunit
MTQPGYALHRRRLLQASAAGLATSAMPACVGYVGSEGTFDSVDGSASVGPSESESLDASSSPEVYVPPPTPASGVDGGPSNQNTPPDMSAGPTDAGEPAEPMDSGSMDAGRPAAPTAGCYQDTNTFVLSLAQHPELANAGGSAIFTDGRYADPICEQNSFYIVKTKPGQYAAYSIGCPHQCCYVEIKGSSVSCPCHGSKFNLLTGKVTAGPATKNLPSLPVSTDGSNVCVQLAP